MQHRVAKVVGVHEDIKGDDQHRQEAEDAAEHSHDGTENRPDRLTALANRRGFDRLADADVLLQQSPFDEELLRAVQHLRRGLDKRLALLVERREGQHSDADERADQEEIQNEGSPASAEIVCRRSAATVVSQ